MCLGVRQVRENRLQYLPKEDVTLIKTELNTFKIKHLRVLLYSK